MLDVVAENETGDKKGELEGLLRTLNRMEQEQDLFEVASIALKIRVRFPNSLEGYSHGATALRILGQLGEAAAVIRDAIALFPDEFGPAEEAFWVAVARNDISEMAAVCENLRDKFPGRSLGYSTQALRRLGRFDEAMAVAQSAIARFPGQPWPLIEAGDVACMRGDYGSALSSAGQIQQQFPEQQGGYALSIVSLRSLGRFEEAAVSAHAAIERFPGEQWPYRENGIILRHLERYDDALIVARKAKERFPGEAWPALEEASLFHTQGLFQEAGAVLLAATKTFPRERGILEELAKISNLRRQPGEADRYYEMLIKLYPRDSTLALQYATRPVHFEAEKSTGGEQKALQRLDDLHRQFPDFDDAYVAHAELLMRSQRLAEADVLLVACEPRLARHQRLSLAWTDVAIARQDFDEATKRLQQFKLWFPMVPDGYIRLAKVWGRLGRQDEGDAVCKEAMERFPASPDLQEAYAWVAQLSGNIAVAVDRWKEGQRLYSQDLRDDRFKAGAYEAQLALIDQMGSIPGAAQDAGTPPDGPKADALDPNALMMRFQSLGSPTNGCEFGSVQRYFGAEPLGLLRWVAVKPRSFIQALNDGFEGLFDEEGTEIQLAVLAARPEDMSYHLYFKYYDLHMDTWVYTSEVSKDQFSSRHSRRLKLLVRKFKEDLAGDENIFVYKEDLLDISDTQAEEMLAAMRGYGSDNTLLFIRHSDGDHPEGTVRKVKQGLFFGYIDHFIITRDGSQRPIRFDAWLAVCKEAFRLWATEKAALPVTTA